MQFINEIADIEDATSVLETAYSLHQRFMSMRDIPDELIYLTHGWQQQKQGGESIDHRSRRAANDEGASNALTDEGKAEGESHEQTHISEGVPLQGSTLADDLEELNTEDVDEGEWTEIIQ